jgi:hypothetical protein
MTAERTQNNFEQITFFTMGENIKILTNFILSKDSFIFNFYAVYRLRIYQKYVV